MMPPIKNKAELKKIERQNCRKRFERMMRECGYLDDGKNNMLEEYYGNARNEGTEI